MILIILIFGVGIVAGIYISSQINNHIDKTIKEDIEASECCGAKFMDDSDLCPKCGEHTGREL